MKISKTIFGKFDGKDVYKFLLENSNGVEVEIINYGCIITKINVPDRNGNMKDVVLGHDTLKEYLVSKPYFGAIVGRHANRIEDARFVINGEEYNLAKNNGENHIHGGIKGFDKAIWEFEVLNEGEKEILCLNYRSIDGEEGYPGNLDVTVKYSLSEDNALSINYYAVSDKDTVLNLTNHSYFNLEGQDSQSIYNHQLKINSNQFTPVNSVGLPIGEINDVSGTQMDFREFKQIGIGLESDDQNIIEASGYDHNWVLNIEGKAPNKIAEVYEPISGRVMEVFTTKPGVQLYTGNWLTDSIIGKNNVRYKKHCSLCLETQYYPNALKHSHFPSPILKKGDEYNHTTIYKFDCR